MGAQCRRFCTGRRAHGALGAAPVWINRALGHNDAVVERDKSHRRRGMRWQGVGVLIKPLGMPFLHGQPHGVSMPVMPACAVTARRPCGLRDTTFPVAWLAPSLLPVAPT